MAISSHQAHPFTGIDLHAGIVKQYMICESFGYGFYIIITEKLADTIRPRMEALRLLRKRPLIVEIPGPEGPLPGIKDVGEFVQEAVGMRISQEVIHGNRP